MIVSQPAILCLAATFHRLLGRTIGESSTEQELAPGGACKGETSLRSLVIEPPPSAGLVQAEATAPEPLRVHVVAADAPLSANELRARAAALRALALARGRRFESSRSAFTEAARLDPALDLTRTPGFWKLERSAHEAAIDAYIVVGRDGDAAVLRARIRSTYRPKPIRQRAGAALPS